MNRKRNLFVLRIKARITSAIVAFRSAKGRYFRGAKGDFVFPAFLSFFAWLSCLGFVFSYQSAAQSLDDPIGVRAGSQEQNGGRKHASVSPDRQSPTEKKTRLKDAYVRISRKADYVWVTKTGREGGVKAKVWLYEVNEDFSSLKFLRTFELLNPVSPGTGFLSPDGRYFVTFDEFDKCGNTPRDLVIYDLEQGTNLARSIEEFLPESTIAQLKSPVHMWAKGMREWQRFNSLSAHYDEVSGKFYPTTPFNARRTPMPYISIHLPTGKVAIEPIPDEKPKRESMMHGLYGGCLRTGWAMADGKREIPSGPDISVDYIGFYQREIKERGIGVVKRAFRLNPKTGNYNQTDWSKFMELSGFKLKPWVPDPEIELSDRKRLAARGIAARDVHVWASDNGKYIWVTLTGENLESRAQVSLFEVAEDFSSLTFQRKFDLLNPVCPSSEFLTPDGKYFVTLNELGRCGSSPRDLVIYDLEGRTSLARSIDDFLPETVIAKLRGPLDLWGDGLRDWQRFTLSGHRYDPIAKKLYPTSIHVAQHAPIPYISIHPETGKVTIESVPEKNESVDVVPNKPVKRLVPRNRQIGWVMSDGTRNVPREIGVPDYIGIFQKQNKKRGIVPLRLAYQRDPKTGNYTSWDWEKFVKKSKLKYKSEDP